MVAFGFMDNSVPRFMEEFLIVGYGWIFGHKNMGIFLSTMCKNVDKDKMGRRYPLLASVGLLS